MRPLSRKLIAMVSGSAFWIASVSPSSSWVLLEEQPDESASGLHATVEWSYKFGAVPRSVSRSSFKVGLSAPGLPYQRTEGSMLSSRVPLVMLSFGQADDQSTIKSLNVSGLTLLEQYDNRSISLPNYLGAAEGDGKGMNTAFIVLGVLALGGIIAVAVGSGGGGKKGGGAGGAGGRDCPAYAPYDPVSGECAGPLD